MMPETLCFYMDDSGTRHLDRKPSDNPPLHDWFALGGVLIKESDLKGAQAAINAFRQRWPEMGEAPLHSVEVRNKTGGFRWLVSASAARKAEFIRDMSELMMRLPIIVLACVINRPGYNARYKEAYGAERWALCRTAFTIAVERAAKFALAHNSRLRVFVERSDPKTERRLKGYYDDLRAAGPPFDASTSAKYQPLKAQSLANTLLEFDVKTKASRLMQIADIALWPACKGGYEPTNKAFVILRDTGKLLDVHCTEENGLRGIKYSCFDDAEKQPERQKPAEAGS